MLSSTGDQSPVIEAKGDVSISYGLDEERVKAMLERQQEELFRKLRESGFAADDGERRLLEQQLQAVSAKLADIERSYEEELARRKAADAALAQLRGQLPEAQIENAQANLRQGDKDAAKSVFRGVLDKEGASVALAAFQLGQMAESDLNYAEAMRMYKKAVVLEEDKPEYLLAAVKLAREMAEYKQAQDWLERLLEIREAEGENAELGNALHELALLRKNQGRYDEAEPLYLRAVAVKEKALGRDHPDVADVLNNLAVLYWRKGKYAEAEPLYLRALAVKEKNFGKEHQSVAQTLNDLSLFYWDQSLFAKAESLCLRAFNIRKKYFGEQHLDVAESLNNLGLFRNSEAESLYLRSIAIKEKLLGEKHPSVAITLGGLSKVYMDRKDYEKSEQLLLRSLAIKEHFFGKEHRFVTLSLNKLAFLYRKQNRYQEAEQLYLRSLSIKEKEITLHSLAKFYFDQGRYEEAEPLYQRAISIMREKFPSGHPKIDLYQKDYDELKQKMAEQSK